MRVLFYLPVVTPWWFEHIVEPMIRHLATVAEVDVLAPAPWRNTGIGPDDLARCIDLDSVRWHIVEGEDHPSLRTKPADLDGLLAFVRHLSPDVMLCRASDFETAAHFPGAVRFLMEAAVPPFDMAAATIVLTERPLAQGMMPELMAAEKARLEAIFDPLWTEMQAHWQQEAINREAIFASLGIPEDRPMLLLALEYEHEENFFLQHRLHQDGIGKFLTTIAEQVTKDFTLVVTDHPLNRLYVDRQDLDEAISSLGPHVILAETKMFGFSSTPTLARHAAGLLFGDSKVFGIGAAFGIPMLRYSRFSNADWLKTEIELIPFVSAIRNGNARRPTDADARLWFAFHCANDAFDPEDADLTGDDILDRVLRPVNPDRWEPGLARVRAVKQ